MKLSNKVVRVLLAEQISFAELQHMVQHAAITSLRGCNRRYHQWLFRVKDDVLLDMQQATLVEVGRGGNRMMEEHDPCVGEGCHGCGWSGVISRGIEDATASSLEFHP